ncbi:NADH dehydrogenase DsrE [Bacillus subtilis subsp. subtilis]|nr:hypothetical protein C7M26_00068 [Bacillus subtilis]QJD00966.1 NADH dehydrogenase DsrE [Bacillus subtilis subsp. subtilis]QJD04948.1 NADH dehydrogenase DsrE [Bacillus subtilis subsp. subtilis]TWG66487.1 DsrE/DsrF/DrsH-like protein [Bacillus subtilis J24]TWG73854.1 DsrE/DsrF/DrsH-like protein [Bacillus subtilis J26]
MLIKSVILRQGKEHVAEGCKKANVPSIPELIEMAQEMGVTFIGCHMTMDVMGLTKDDFIEGNRSRRGCYLFRFC